MFKQTNSPDLSNAYRVGFLDGYSYGMWAENPCSFNESLSKAYEEGRADGIKRWNEKENCRF